eukprot:TRINITY_DN3122_c0_g2_i1.p1 TRINITY_DN3122_c0_g2~~TRINITY_DN3122_c0_g2_i1.p1  ORF type:complete len:2992 (+),score=492.15 TRINITY_DN3122_c0_g2_i1:63-9038(+)
MPFHYLISEVCAAILILVVLLLAPLQSDAAVYMSPTGSDANSGGLLSPVFTLNRAVALAAAVDDIYAGAGTFVWGSQFLPSGAKKISVYGAQANNPDATTFQGDSALLVSVSNPLIYLGPGVNHNITFRDITFRSNSSGSLWMESTLGSVTFLGCQLRSNAETLRSRTGVVSVINSSLNRAAYVVNNINMTYFTNTTWSGISSTFSGAALYITTSNVVTVDRCRMTGVTGPIAAAIYVNSTQLVLSNSVFNNNTAYSSIAGVLYSLNSTVTIVGSRFEDNMGSGAAAIFASSRSSISISSSTFSRNVAYTDVGGAIYTSGGTLSITGSTFDGNQATTHGGAVFTSSTTVVITSTVFYQNLAPTGYGAICLSASPSATITNATFDSNLSDLGGGAYVESSTQTFIDSSVFKMNAVPGDFGGGLCLNNAGALVTNTRFESNSAVSAGAFLALRSSATLSNCDFTSNVATGFGGAILTIPPISGSVSGSNCRFVSNIATRGGALAIQGSSSSFSNSVFALNQAAFGASAYLVESGGPPSLALSSSIMESGTASIIAGGIYLGPNSKLSILSSIIRNNTAGITNLAGAIFSNGSQIVFTSSVMDSNSALNGGAIFAGANGATPTDIVINGTSIFSSNAAATGGAIHMVNSNLRSYGTNFFHNGATDFGGAIVAVTPSQFLVAGNNFTQNYLYPRPSTSVFGGAIFVVSYDFGGTVSINNTIFNLNQVIAPTNSSNTFGGAAIFDSVQTVQLHNNTWRRNAGHDTGGAIVVRSFPPFTTTLTISKNYFMENFANDGGAIFIGGPSSSTKVGRATITDSTFEGNVAFRADGASVCAGGALSFRSFWDASISRTSFNDNGVSCDVAVDQGGAIFSNPATDPDKFSTLSLDSCSFDGNFLGTPDSIGAAMLTLSTEVIIVNSNFSNHGTYQQGAALFLQSSNDAPVRINGSRFINNNAEVSGGAISLSGDPSVRPTFVCGDCTFISNRATQPARPYSAAYGGAISLASPWHVTIDRGAFIDNSASSTARGEFSAAGGAVGVGSWNSTLFGVFAEIHIADSFFDSNAVGPRNAYGGAVSMREGGDVTIKRSTFLHSSSSFRGGAVSVALSPTLIEDTVFGSSSATCSGGAVRIIGNNTPQDVLVVLRSNFSDNSMFYDADNTTGTALACDYMQGGGLTGLFLNKVDIRDSTFSNNSIEWSGTDREGSVDAAGGAVHINSDGISTPNITVSGCLFSRNRAIGPDAIGGGLFSGSSNLTIFNTTFDSNTGSTEGAGMMFHPSNNISRSLYMVGNTFTSNFGCNGGGAQIYMRAQTRAIISDNRFVGNLGFVSTSGFCTAASGLGMQITGFSYYFPNVTRCLFANNTVFDIGAPRAPGDPIRASGIALRIVVDPSETRETLYPFGVVDSVISDTLATTDDAAWGALGILASNQRAFVENTLFLRNRIMNYAGIDVGGTGAALVASGVAGYSPGLSMFSLRNCRFQSNSADVGGSAMLRNSHSTLHNVTFVDNSGFSLAGALLIIGSEIVNVSAITAAYPYTTFVRGGTRFISNRAGYSTDGCCYASLMVQGNHTLTVDTSTRFLLNEFDTQTGLATDMGCIVNATCRVVPVAAPGESVDLSGVLLAEFSTLDLSQVEATMKTLKVWDRAFISKRSYVILGSYNLTSTNVTLFNFVTVASPSVATGGQLNLYGQTEIVGAAPTKVFQSVRVNNFGVVKNYESTVVMRNSVVFNDENASWDFENFSPQVNWTGSPTATTPARFINRGRLSLPSGSFQNVTIDSSAPSSSLRFLVSNFWTPSHMSFDPLASVQFGGTFIMEGSPLRDYTEPAPFQTFVVASAQVASSMTVGFQSQESRGGYHFVLNTIDVGPGRNLTLQVVGFYPVDVRINDEATFIRVTFPRPTNVPGGILGTDCSLFLEYSFLSSLVAPECIWKTSTELNVRTSKILSLGTIAFKDAIITDMSEPTFYVWGNKTHTVSLPIHKPAPKIILVAPATVAPCADIFIDASATFGTGAFSLTFSWTLEYINDVSPSTLGTAASNLASLVASQTSSSFTIPAASLQAAWSSFNITVTATAAGLGTSSTSRTRITRDAASLLQVRIEGPSSRIIPTAVDSQILATFSVPSCQPLAPSNVVRSSWSILSSSQPTASLAPVLKGLNTTILYIPARAFAPDSVHKFQYTASVFADSSSVSPISSTSAIVSVSAVGSPMSLISVGKGGLVSTSQPIPLEVRLDDPDEASYLSTPEPPQFAWVVLACPDRGQRNTKTSSDAEIAFAIQQSSAGTFEENNTTRTLDNVKGRQTGAVCSYPNGTRYTIPFPTASVGAIASSFTIPANFLAPGEYTLLAIAARGSRSATGLISMSVDPTTVTYNTVRIEAELRGADKHLSQNKLILRGFVDGANSVPSQRTVRWSLVGQAINTSAVTTSVDNINLVLSPSALLPGRGYTFQLDVFMSGTTITGSNTLTVVVNSSPRGGNFTASPALGALQGAPLDIALPGWIDDDPPLRYVVSAVEPLSGKAVVLSDLIELPTMSVSVPFAGAVSNNYLLELRAHISDTFESVTTVSQFVQLLPNSAYQSGSQTSSQSRDSLIAAMRFARVAGDFRAAMTSIMQLLPLISAEPAIKCEVAMTIDVFARSIQLSAATMQSILQPLDQITSNNATMSPCIMDITLAILERAVQGSEAASRLSASQNSAARSAAIEVLRAISNLIKSLSSMQGVDEATRIRLLQQVLSLAKVQNAFAVLDEVPTLLTANDLLVLTANLSASALANTNITLGEVQIILTLVDPNGRVDLNLVRWLNSTFPLSTISGQIIGSTVITTTTSGGQVGTVTVIFGPGDSKPADPTATTTTPVACGVYDEAQKKFDTTGCSLKAAPGGSYSCTCSRVGSLTLLFDLGSSGATTPPGVIDVSGTSVAGIAAGVTLGLLAIFAGVGAAYFIKRHKDKKAQRENFRQRAAELQQKQDEASPGDAAEMQAPASQPSLVGRPSNTWAVARPSVSAGDVTNAM